MKFGLVIDVLLLVLNTGYSAYGFTHDHVFWGFFNGGAALLMALLINKRIKSQ